MLWSARKRLRANAGVEREHDRRGRRTGHGNEGKSVKQRVCGRRVK